jgi:hypothetical protein
MPVRDGGAIIAEFVSVHKKEYRPIDGVYGWRIISWETINYDVGPRTLSPLRYCRACGWAEETV